MIQRIDCYSDVSSQTPLKPSEPRNLKSFQLALHEEHLLDPRLWEVIIYILYHLGKPSMGLINFIVTYIVICKIMHIVEWNSP